MAGNKPKSVQRNSDVVYLKCDLDKQLKKDLQKWLETEHDIFDMIEKAIDSGLRFGSGYDAYNDCVQSTLTQVATPENGNKTVVLVGRGGSLVQALQALFFKYTVILQGVLEDGERQNARGVTDWG